jgi:uncharacterized protein DUF3987
MWLLAQGRSAGSAQILRELDEELTCRRRDCSSQHERLRTFGSEFLDPTNLVRRTGATKAVPVICLHKGLSPTLPCPLPLVPHPPAPARTARENAYRQSGTVPPPDPASIAKELRTHGEQAPEATTLRRYKTNDSTVEKAGELLRENPAGLLVVRDELVGLIAMWEREGREGERAFFLEAWNGNQSFDTDRIGRGHISIPNLCVSIFGGIKPDKLTVYLEQAAHALANDGMLQRFQMLVYPDPRRWEWRVCAPDKAARDAAFAVFEKLVDFDPLAWGAALAAEFVKFSHFRLSDEAQAVFIEWSGDMHRARIPNEDEPLIRQHLAKFDKLFPALALTFHLVDSAAQGIRGPVTKDAALRAAAWCEYLEAHCAALLWTAEGRRAKAGAGFGGQAGTRDVRGRLHAARCAGQSVAQPDCGRRNTGRPRLARRRRLAAQRGHRRHRPRQRAPHSALPHPSRDQGQA